MITTCFTWLLSVALAEQIIKQATNIKLTDGTFISTSAGTYQFTGISNIGIFRTLSNI